jgi:hypothetical protein
MSRLASKIGAGMATAIGVVSTLAIVVLLFAGAPNASPEQWALLRNAMVVAAAGGAASLLVAIVLITQGRVAGAAWIGLLPFLALVALIAYAA